MRETFLTLVLIGLSMLVGCSSVASTNPTDYLGEYIFVPAERGAERFRELSRSE